MNYIDSDLLLKAIQNRRTDICEVIDYFDVADFELDWIEKFILKNQIVHKKPVEQTLNLFSKDAIPVNISSKKNFLKSLGFEDEEK